MGMNGPTGLEYSSIEPFLRLSQVPEDEWPEIFEGFQIMEWAAIEQIRENAEES